MSGFLNRRRASKLMLEQGLSALVLAQPESITYATGAFPGVASFWRRAGAAFVVVPADEEMPLTAIVGDLQAKDYQRVSGIADVRTHPIWVEADHFPIFEQSKPRRMPRPAQYDVQISVDLLRDVLHERGLLNSRIGLELAFIPVADFKVFEKIDLTWVNCSNLVEQLRTIKSPVEIAKLRNAAEFASAGVAVLTQSIEVGMTAQQMSEIWKTAAHAEAVRRGNAVPQSSWAYIAVGGDGFAPGGPISDGDIIKIDVGCVIDGYSSDGGRTAVFGSPYPDAIKIFDALHRAFDAGFKLLQPGVPLTEVYKATVTTMWNQGFETYNRGHFGHGVGASIWSEEWPFISNDATAVAEPGMVLAFETPWYISGLGGFIIEDQILITETGCDVMAPSPRGMIGI